MICPLCNILDYREDANGIPRCVRCFTPVDRPMDLGIRLPDAPKPVEAVNVPLPDPDVENGLKIIKPKSRRK